MDALTMDELSMEPASLERRLGKVSFRLSLVSWAELIALADESLSLVREMRSCVYGCSMPPHFDECLGRIIKAGHTLPSKMRRLYGRLPFFFWSTKRKALLAADEWERLAEDVSMISTPEKRAALDDLEKAASSAKDNLPSWRDSSLFQ